MAYALRHIPADVLREYFFITENDGTSELSWRFADADFYMILAATGPLYALTATLPDKIGEAKTEVIRSVDAARVKLDAIERLIRGLTVGGDPSAIIDPVNAYTGQVGAAVVDQVNAYTEAVGKYLAAQHADILAAIAGVSGGGGPEVVAALERLRSSLDRGLTNVFTNESLADTTGRMAGSIPALVNAVGILLGADVADVAHQVSRIVEALGRAPDPKAGAEGFLAALQDKLPSVGETFKGLESWLTPENPEFLAALRRAEAGVSPIDSELWPYPVRVGIMAWQYVIAGRGPELVHLLSEQFAPLLDALRLFARVLMEAIMEGLGVLHAGAEGVMGIGSTVLFDKIEEELMGVGRTNPENVMRAASRLFTVAGAAGLTSHALAVATEHYHPLKHLGFPQIAAFLTDLAGFSGIARNSLGVAYQAALASPARRRAMLAFRPEIPDSGRIDEMYLRREITSQAFEEYYAQQGWTEEWVEHHRAALFRGSNPRELALVFEDGAVDDDWGLRMLQRAGYDNDDAGRLLAGVKTRASKSPRQGLIAAAEAAYVEGVLDDGALQGRLVELGLQGDPLRFALDTANLRRAIHDAHELRTELLAAVALGASAPEDAAAQLAAYGYDGLAAQHGADVAAARLGRTLFRQTHEDERAATRKLQAEAVALAQELYRRSLVDDAGFSQLVTAYGVDERGAQLALRMARVRRTPVPKLADVLTVEAQAQLTVQHEAVRVLALQARGEIDEAEAIAQLVGLGVDPGEAIARAGVVEARLTPRPDIVRAPTATQIARETRRVRGDAAVAAYRSGQLEDAALLAALEEAGEPAGLAAATVAAEAARRARAGAANQRTREQAEARAARRAEEQLAVTAFRAGRLSEDGLLQTLRAIGFPQAEAEAVARREATQKFRAAALADEREAEAGAARVRAARTAAAVAAYHAHRLTGDELEAELVAAGVPQAEAEAIRRREEARRTPTRP